MKSLLFIVALFISSTTILAQSASTAASNHVFVMCDEEGTPITSSGQSFYLAFYTNGQVIMMCGSTLERAISNVKAAPSTSKSGTWESYGSKLWFTWSDGSRSEDWYINTYTGNFQAGSIIMRDLGKF